MTLEAREFRIDSSFPPLLSLGATALFISMERGPVTVTACQFPDQSLPPCLWPLHCISIVTTFWPFLSKVQTRIVTPESHWRCSAMNYLPTPTEILTAGQTNSCSLPVCWHLWSCCWLDIISVGYWLFDRYPDIVKLLISDTERSRSMWWWNQHITANLYCDVPHDE